jgi:hypothetical protein
MGVPLSVSASLRTESNCCAPFILEHFVQQPFVDVVGQAYMSFEAAVNTMPAPVMTLDQRSDSKYDEPLQSSWNPFSKSVGDYLVPQMVVRVRSMS